MAEVGYDPKVSDDFFVLKAPRCLHIYIYISCVIKNIKVMANTEQKPSTLDKIDSGAKKVGAVAGIVGAAVALIKILSGSK